MTRILIIDDDDLVREQLMGWFEREGYEVTEANDGPAGVQQALGQPPDLIVCDIAMPEMSGYEVLEAVRGHAQTTTMPFIFLTGQTDKAFMRHGMELGADDYLTKPFTRPEVLAAVRTRLKRRAVIADALTQELEAAKTHLSRLVAHELKTPLISIQMVKDLVERQIGQLQPGDIQNLMDTLGAGTERLHHLVEQMVFLTQLDAGVLSREKIQETGFGVQVWQLVPSAIDLGRRFAFRNRDLSVVSDLRDEQAAIHAHLPALKHALAELIANALNFSPADGKVTISEWQSDSAVWISIYDEGIGMSAAERAKAFETYAQIHRDSREQQGMGLGLPLVRRIVEAHGGDFELESVTNKGTQALVRLPVM